MAFLKSYRLLPYLALVPFLVFTYNTWCGPIESISSSTACFMVFSAAALIFICGCWWGISYSQSEKICLRMMLVGLIFGLGAVLILAFTGLSFAVPVLGLAHLAIWILEFFVPQIELSHNYRVQRAVLTMTIVVCHMLVAIQFLSS